MSNINYCYCHRPLEWSRKSNSSIMCANYLPSSFQYLACLFTLTQPGPSSKIDVVCQSSWSQNEKSSFFYYRCLFWCNIFSVVCQVVQAKVVGVTVSERTLVIPMI